MTHKKPELSWKQKGGIVLIAIGVFYLLAEVTLSLIGKRDIEWRSVSVSALIGYAGFAILNGKGAKEQGQFVVDSVVRIVGTVRSGRRTVVMNKVEEPPAGQDERRTEPSIAPVKPDEPAQP